MIAVVVENRNDNPHQRGIGPIQADRVGDAEEFRAIFARDYSVTRLIPIQHQAALFPASDKITIHGDPLVSRV